MSQPGNATANSHRALIQQAFALQNAHEADALAALHAPDSVFQDIPLQAFPNGHEEMKTLWRDTWASLSNFRMDPDFIIADETGGAASFTMSGTHTGDFPGYPATGNTFSLKGASVIRIVDGKVVEWIDYWSTGDLEQQLQAR
jgi:steroid delta-isomerase-like uncharacterized protein